jgi:multisubunit Na+/H+ antiporter MnhC subunit
MLLFWIVISVAVLVFLASLIAHAHKDDWL